MVHHSLDSFLQQTQDHPYLSTFVGLALLAALAVSPTSTFGMARPKYWHSAKPLILKTRAGKTTSLAQLCQSLIPPCRLNPFLFNGHLQTIWTVLARDSVPIYYKRRIFENDDPIYTGQFSVDFVTKPNNDSDPNLPPRTTYFTDQEFENIGSLDTRPMLVLLHGLSGGSHELYLRHVLAPLVDDGRWEACVIISRGCSKTQITTSVLYNARATWDVRHTVKWLKETFPNRPLFGIGFSLGANIITNASICPSVSPKSCSLLTTCSILVKRAVTVLSKLPSFCPIHGIFMQAAWPCKEPGSIEMPIPWPWERA